MEQRRPGKTKLTGTLIRLGAINRSIALLESAEQTVATGIAVRDSWGQGGNMEPSLLERVRTA